MNRMSHPILLAIVWQSPLPKIMDCRVGGGLQEMWCCLCLGLNLFGHLLISFFYFSYLSWSNLSVVTAMFLPICFDHLLMSFISVSVDYISLATAISCWFFETIFFFSFLSQISFLRLWPSFLLTCFTIFRFLFLSGLPSSSHLSCWLFFTFFLSRVPFWGHGHLSRWLLTTQNLRPAFTPAYLSSLFGPFFYLSIQLFYDHSRPPNLAARLILSSAASGQQTRPVWLDVGGQFWGRFPRLRQGHGHHCQLCYVLTKVYFTNHTVHRLYQIVLYRQKQSNSKR